MRFNKVPAAGVTNYAGGQAFKMNPKDELATRVLTSLVGEPSYYVSATEMMSDLIRSVNNVLQFDPEFVLKLAVFARTEMHLRTVPILLWTLYANCNNKTVNHASAYGLKIVQRADEILELMAAQKNLFPGKTRGQNAVKLPRITKTVIRSALNLFDAYQFGKYNSGGSGFKFRDAIFLTHPSPKDPVQQEIFQKLVDNQLEPPETWEVLISTKGSTKENWEEIIPKMGFMALLRNLRNFEKVGVDSELVTPTLLNLNAVKRSKQLPFRFASAFDTVNSTDYKNAVEGALQLSLSNLPRLNGSTLALVDISGSMDSVISSKTGVTRKSIATLFGAICPFISERFSLVAFGTDFRQIEYNPKETPLLQVKAKIYENSRTLGWSTEAWKPFNMILNNKIAYDRIILISDMQCYNSSGRADVDSIFQEYLRTVNPNCKLYSIDLCGYGTSKIDPNNPNVFLMAGWSERILELIPLLDSKTDMVSIIENYQCIIC